MTTKMIYQHSKNRQHSALLTTGELTPPYQSASVNTMAGGGKPSGQSPKRVNIPTGTTSLTETLSSPTNSAKKSVNREMMTIAAGFAKAALSTLLAAHLIRRAHQSGTGDIVLVLPSTYWNEDLTLK